MHSPQKSKRTPLGQMLRLGHSSHQEKVHTLKPCITLVFRHDTKLL